MNDDPLGGRRRAQAVLAIAPGVVERSQGRAEADRRGFVMTEARRGAGVRQQDVIIIGVAIELGEPRPYRRQRGRVAAITDRVLPGLREASAVLGGPGGAAKQRPEDAW